MMIRWSGCNPIAELLWKLLEKDRPTGSESDPKALENRKNAS
jgi:hypothetical protein